jgi:hypothetical protein
VPVWHEATRQAVADGRLVLLGVTQEQHPKRCRLFAQWKQFGWPILSDPINVLGAEAVPIVLALDEHGIVRSTRPNPATFESEFLSKPFADDATNNPQPLAPPRPTTFEELEPAGEAAKSADAWVRYGDALALWGGQTRLAAAIGAYRQAARLEPRDGAAWFRLGVCLRLRSETPDRQPGDFRSAVEAWGTAVEINPNQYIWRRRIQQYGPRLDKPYPFYDWVAEAERAIRDRGDLPVALPVRPEGAELAEPIGSFAVEKERPREPDPQGKIARDRGSVVVEVVPVPAPVRPGQSARVHLTFRLSENSKDHWNNEAEPLRVWTDPPDGFAVSERLVEAETPKSVSSTEDRTVAFEVQIPKGASGTVRLPAYALYHLCNEAGGQCRLVRLDIAVELMINKQ